MTMPRSSLVSLTDTPWYHVVCRCVRRAFLRGEDHTTGQTFFHAIGAPDKLIELAAHKNNRYLHGIARARKLYQKERVA